MLSVFQKRFDSHRKAGDQGHRLPYISSEGVASVLKNGRGKKPLGDPGLGSKRFLYLRNTDVRRDFRKHLIIAIVFREETKGEGRKKYINSYNS